MSQSSDLGRLTTSSPGYTRPRPSVFNLYNARKIAGYSLVYIVLTAIALIFMIPLLWMLSTSLKARAEIMAFPPQWIPAHLHLENYAMAFAKYPLARFMLNTSILVVLNIIGQLIAVPIVAYGFARMEFPLKKVLFVLMLSGMMIPYQVTLIPLYTMFSRLHLLNTYVPLVVPSFFGNPFFIFFMVQYIRTIPRDLDEAGRIDGAGTWTILYRIILPLCKPILAVMVVFQFLWTWNDFIQPLIYLNSFELYPIGVGLSFFQGRYSVEWNLFMAATLVSIIPILILYFFAQKHLIGGIASIGLKG